MKKKYSSSSHLVLNLATEDGENIRLRFDPLTGGGSSYTTEDESMQKLLDNHPYYGKKFVGRELPDEPKPEIVSTEINNKGPKLVKVSSTEDAKDYLAENFDMSRAKLRTRAACISAGEENGIEFVWE